MTKNDLQSADELLSQITQAVPYMRMGLRDKHQTWYRASDLISSENQLLELVRSTGTARGIDRDDISVSLFMQAYGFRAASAAIAGWILSDRTQYLGVSPENFSIAIGRNRPNAVGFDALNLATDSIYRNLFDGHLGPLVDAAHQAINAGGDSRVGEKMLWGNIGAGVASTFGVFSAVVAEPATVRDLAAEFMDEAPTQIQNSGTFVLYQGERPEPAWAWERSSCCLWYQVPPADPTAEPFKCTDCSLWSAEERLARYVAATGAIS